MTTKLAERHEGLPEERSMSGIDVVFIAPVSATASGEALMRRTIVFALGEAIPRIGECVILAFGMEPSRWQVEDVAHVFEGDAHGIAIKLMPPAAG
jgi:hypothetical protein